MKSELFKNVLATLLLTVSCSAMSVPVYIDGIAGGATLNLEAGTYRMAYAGGAWNAWNGQTGNGKGWLNNWGASIPGAGSYFRGTGVYGSASSAAAAADSSPIFFTTTGGTVVFTNGDPKNYLADNVGGSFITVTKSLGSEAKDSWAVARDTASLASQITTFIGLAVAAGEVSGFGAPAVLATFLALGLAGAALTIAGNATAYASALTAITEVLRNIGQQVASGVAQLSAALQLSLLGLGLTAASIFAQWRASDPPNPSYMDVPKLAAAQFDNSTADGRFFNTLLMIPDASLVNMQATERQQGALLANDRFYADKQATAAAESAAAMHAATIAARSLSDSVIGGLPMNVPTLSSTDLAKFIDDFLQMELPAESIAAVTAFGLTEAEFKEQAVAAFLPGRPGFSKDDLALLAGAGYEGIRSSIRAEVAQTVPEPPTGGLALLTIALMLACRSSRRTRLHRGRSEFSSKQNLHGLIPPLELDSLASTPV